MSTPYLVMNSQAPAALVSPLVWLAALGELFRENHRLREAIAFYELNFFHSEPAEPECESGGEPSL